MAEPEYVPGYLPGDKVEIVVATAAFGGLVVDEADSDPTGLDQHPCIILDVVSVYQEVYHACTEAELHALVHGAITGTAEDDPRVSCSLRKHVTGWSSLLGRGCHRWVTENPRAAADEGWVLSRFSGRRRVGGRTAG